MKKLTNFLKGFAIDYVIKYLTNNKDEVVAKLNKEIDLPILSEKQEKDLLDAIYDTTLTVVKGIKQMIPSLIPKQVLPLVIKPVKKWLLKHFKGIEKISYLVDYMEKPNEADKKIEELVKENIILESKIKNMRNEVNELKLDFQKWKKNA